MIATTGKGHGVADPHEHIYPLISFTLGSAAGLADLLRSGRKLGMRAILASMLWHGLMSAATAMLLSEQIANRAILYGISILVGAGVFSIADVLVAGVRSRIGLGRMGGPQDGAGGGPGQPPP